MRILVFKLSNRLRTIVLISRLTICSAEDKHVGGWVFLGAASTASPKARVPVHVCGVRIVRQSGQDRAVIVVQQVPPQDLVVVAARVDLVRTGPANTADQLTMWAVVKEGYITKQWITLT